MIDKYIKHIQQRGDETNSLYTGGGFLKGKKRVLTPLGSIIKKRLIELNKTQKQLAESIGTSEKYLYLILYGYRSGEKYIGFIEKELNLDLKSYKNSA